MEKYLNNILSYFQKKTFLVVISNFYDKTGNWISKVILFSVWQYQTIKYVVNILKISQLVLELWAKNLFWTAILSFSRWYRKLNFLTFIFCKSLQSNLKICHRSFENISISSRVISKNPVFGGHFDFSWQNWK